MTQPPLDLDRYPELLRLDVEEAVNNVLSMDPLPPGDMDPLPDRGTLLLPDTAPRLIGISGRSRVGKDTVADAIYSRYRDVERMNFSDMIIREVNDWLSFSGHLLTEANKSDNRYRHLLQAWGLARREEDSGYWTRSMRREVEGFYLLGARLVLVCGVRALSDLEAVEEMGGVHWRVIRPSNSYEADHPIERQLDDLPPERQTLIENDIEGSVQPLQKRVFSLLGE